MLRSNESGRDRDSLEQSVAATDCLGGHFSGRDPSGEYHGAIVSKGTIEFHWLEIEHDGSISWDIMQAIKNAWFGPEVTCFEIFQPRRM